MFRGSIVAMVTPFKDGKVDEEAYRELIETQVDGGTSAIVPCGTTGESATLTFEEHKQAIAVAVNAVNKRIPVIAGTGGNRPSYLSVITLNHNVLNLGAPVDKSGPTIVKRNVV